MEKEFIQKNNNCSLALRYRPDCFEDVSSQKSLITILNKQLEKESFKNCYIFAGPSGVGKTTIARIFANKINKGLGEPVEIDAASNNSADDVRRLVDLSIERSLDSEYKIIIMDECHMLSNAAWNAFLKCIEEPPKYTIFMFCTTNPDKIPQTIYNRCQVYNLQRVADDAITTKLKQICDLEGFVADDDGINSIVRMSNGSMRQAISYLDKCKDYSTTINEECVKNSLGDYSYDVYFELTNALVDNDKQHIVELVNKLYMDGTDLNVFISNYVSFVLQLSKYCIFGSLDTTNIQKSYEDKVKYATGIENKVEWFNKLVDKILEIKQAIKNDIDAKTTLEIMLLAIGG